MGVASSTILTTRTEGLSILSDIVCVCVCVVGGVAKVGGEEKRS